MADDVAPPVAEDPAHVWLRDVYQGDNARQLTIRSVVTGMLLGGVMSISNLYVGLKTGWGLGVTITASIIAYSVFQFLQQIVPAWRNDHFTILENYTMSSAASAAGYMSSAGLVSAIPALYLTTGRQLTHIELMSWMGAISLLGVFMAIPMKRQMINIEQLPFPSGIATAETLKSMHNSGMEAIQKARSLFIAGILGALVALFKEGPAIFGKLFKLGEHYEKNIQPRITLPSEFPLIPGQAGKDLLEKYTLGFEGSLIMVAAGAIMGIRVGLTLLLGTVIYWCFLANYLLENGLVEGGGYRNLVSWMLWPATSMMVASGLLSFAFRWRTIFRAFAGLFAMLGLTRSRQKDPLDDVEVPDHWFLIGTFVTGLACVLLGKQFFDIPYYMGVLAVLVTFILSVVAARATGETDVTPIGAMGKITQLLFGFIHPGSINTNLMTASVTSGAASHSADLLTDLKTGYLLGGNPRKQLISQLFGVFAGTLFCVPVYLIVVDPKKLGSAEMPAPAAKVWEGVALALSKGWEALPKGTGIAILVGALVGTILTLLEEFAPKKVKRWLPSTTALGIAGVIPAFNCLSMFFGSLIAFIVQKTRPDLDEKYTVAVSSGLIAGETLMGVGLILVGEGPGLVDSLMNAGQQPVVLPPTGLPPSE